MSRDFGQNKSLCGVLQYQTNHVPVYRTESSYPRTQNIYTPLQSSHTQCPQHVSLLVEQRFHVFNSFDRLHDVGVRLQAGCRALNYQVDVIRFPAKVNDAIYIYQVELFPYALLCPSHCHTEQPCAKHLLLGSVYGTTLHPYLAHKCRSWILFAHHGRLL